MSEPVKFPRSFVEDFTCVLTHLQKNYPEQWPTDQLEQLTEEAKEAARHDRQNAIEFYSHCATLIRNGGWHC